jgi:hypothetical protein
MVGVQLVGSAQRPARLCSAGCGKRYVPSSRCGRLARPPPSQPAAPVCWLLSVSLTIRRHAKGVRLLASGGRRLSSPTPPLPSLTPAMVLLGVPPHSPMPGGPQTPAGLSVSGASYHRQVLCGHRSQYRGDIHGDSCVDIAACTAETRMRVVRMFMTQYSSKSR